MTDQATGSTETQTSNSTTDAGGAGGAGGGAAPPAPFYESFKTEALKTHASVQRYKDPEALAQAYVNLEQRYGIEPERRLDLPKDPADTAAMRGVFERLGTPKTADDYGFKLPDTAPEPEKALVGEFTKVAHDLMVPKGQAEGLFKWFTDTAAKAAEAQVAEFAAAKTAGEETLKKEWGAAYEHKTAEIGRLLVKVGDEQLTKDLAGNLGNYPGLAKALGKVLDMMAEPGAAGGTGADSAGGDRPLTPSQAKAKISEIEANPHFRDKNHPQKNALVAERNRLLQIIG